MCSQIFWKRKLINPFFKWQEEQEKKRLEQLQKKAEAKALLEKEMESIKGKVVPPPAKITRAQITHMKEKSAKAEPDKPVVSFFHHPHHSGQQHNTGKIRLRRS